MIDLMRATQDAFFEALSAAVPPTLATVRQHVKQDTRPPLVIIGTIESDNEGSGEQTEHLYVEVQSIYRGGDRAELLAIMHAVRVALDGKPLAATDAELTAPRFVGAVASDAGSDGVTYAGISNFELWATAA